MQDLFADRLGNVTVAGGIARLDFLRLESIDPEKQQMSMKPSMRLVMPLDGLMQTMQMLDKIREELLKQAQAQGQAEQTAETVPAAPAVALESPATTLPFAPKKKS